MCHQQALSQCAKRRKRGLRCSELPAKIRSRKTPLGSAALLAACVTGVVLLLSACASLCSGNAFVGALSPLGFLFPRAQWIWAECGNTDSKWMCGRERRSWDALEEL